MLIIDIIVTCPKCQHQFYSSALGSISAGTPINKNSELVSRFRKCEKCLHTFDIYEKDENGNNAISFPPYEPDKKEEKLSEWQKLKLWYKSLRIR